jgi:hypothetical protein
MSFLGMHDQAALGMCDHSGASRASAFQKRNLIRKWEERSNTSNDAP